MKEGLSLSIPCYNEEENVNLTIPAIFKAFSKEKIPLEIVAVNNGSKDDTLKNLLFLKKKYSGLKIVSFEKNQGFGGGILAGLNKCSLEAVGFTCADSQISPDSILNCYKFFKKNHLDFLKTKRIKRYDGKSRWIVSKIFNIISKILYNIKSEDINGYPVIMGRSLFKKMKISQKDWVINIEMLTKARILGAKMREIDVIFYKRTKGKSSVKMKTVLDFFWQVLKLWPKFLFRKDYRDLRNFRKL